MRAAIETVSENFGDGVVAPLFYLALLGPAGMAAYKAVNTLDSMVGYKDERYLELGWASARLDDALNYVPARLSAIVVWFASALLGMNVVRSVRVTLRDASSQPSPNSGWPEAAFAGALANRGSRRQGRGRRRIEGSSDMDRRDSTQAVGTGEGWGLRIHPSLYPHEGIDMPEKDWHRGSTIETGRGTGPLKPGQPADAKAPA